MILDPTPPTLDNYSPSEIWAWLENIWAKDLKTTTDINWWLSLADSASHRTFYTKQTELNAPDLEWARIAVALYEYLHSVKNCKSCGASGVFLRLRLIQIYGHQPNDELLDAEKVIKWFYVDLPLYKAEVEELLKLDLTQLWKENADKLLKLREIKNRLGVVEHLKKTAEIEISANLKEWIALRKQLP